MTHLPKIGSHVGEYIVESAQSDKSGWRPIAAYNMKFFAMALLHELHPSSYALRVVHVIVVREPAGGDLPQPLFPPPAPPDAERCRVTHRTRRGVFRCSLPLDHRGEHYIDSLRYFPRPRGVAP